LSEEVFTQPGLGDAYITLLKMLKTGKNYKVYCFVDPIYYIQPISEIYSLSDKIELEFVEKPRLDLPEITSDCHEDMEYFPQFNLYNKFYFKHPYFLLQAHSGKIGERNCKKLNIDYINFIIEENKDFRCVLIGSNPIYKNIRNCVNLVGETSIKDLICLAQNCEFFIGPEGFISFVCLSQKKHSIIFYNSQEAVEKRIIATKWEPYSSLKRMY
jgi:ADP-heptose:LPS heptosyltransferase